MNYILRDYQKTGMIKHAKQHQGKYDDIDPIDFQQAMFLVTSAQQQFESLPANIRKKFNNDPSEFLSFTRNPDNAAEMLSLGMLNGVDGFDDKGQPIVEPNPSPADPPQA